MRNRMHSHNIKILLWLKVFVAAGPCLPSRCLATIGDTYRHRDQWEEFMNYDTEMGSGVMMYSFISSFIKIGSDIQKLIGGGEEVF
jgi:cytochrome c oxidase assembly factor CtaG